MGAVQQQAQTVAFIHYQFTKESKTIIGLVQTATTEPVCCAVSQDQHAQPEAVECLDTMQFVANKISALGCQQRPALLFCFAL